MGRPLRCIPQPSQFIGYSSPQVTSTTSTTSTVPPEDISKYINIPISGFPCPIGAFTTTSTTSTTLSPMALDGNINQCSLYNVTIIFENQEVEVSDCSKLSNIPAYGSAVIRYQPCSGTSFINELINTNSFLCVAGTGNVNNIRAISGKTNISRIGRCDNNIITTTTISPTTTTGTTTTGTTTTDTTTTGTTTTGTTTTGTTTTGTTTTDTTTTGTTTTGTTTTDTTTTGTTTTGTTTTGTTTTGTTTTGTTTTGTTTTDTTTTGTTTTGTTTTDTTTTGTTTTGTTTTGTTTTDTTTTGTTTTGTTTTGTTTTDTTTTGTTTTDTTTTGTTTTGTTTTGTTTTGTTTTGTTTTDTTTTGTTTTDTTTTGTTTTDTTTTGTTTTGTTTTGTGTTTTSNPNPESCSGKPISSIDGSILEENTPVNCKQCAVDNNPCNISNFSAKLADYNGVTLGPTNGRSIKFNDRIYKLGIDDIPALNNPNSLLSGATIHGTYSYRNDGDPTTGRLVHFESSFSNSDFEFLGNDNGREIPRHKILTHIGGSQFSSLWSEQFGHTANVIELGSRPSTYYEVPSYTIDYAYIRHSGPISCKYIEIFTYKATRSLQKVLNIFGGQWIDYPLDVEIYRLLIEPNDSDFCSAYYNNCLYFCRECRPVSVQYKRYVGQIIQSPGLVPANFGGTCPNIFVSSDEIPYGMKNSIILKKFARSWSTSGYDDAISFDINCDGFPIGPAYIAPPEGTSSEIFKTGGIGTPVSEFDAAWIQGTANTYYNNCGIATPSEYNNQPVYERKLNYTFYEDNHGGWLIGWSPLNPFILNSIPDFS